MKSKFSSLERFNESILLKKKQIIVKLGLDKAIEKSIKRVSHLLLHKSLLLTIYLVSVENFILQRTQTGLHTNIKPTDTVITAKNKKQLYTC